MYWNGSKKIVSKEWGYTFQSKVTLAAWLFNN